MTANPPSKTGLDAALRVSWLPMIILLMAQIQMGFNVNAIPVSIGPITADLDTSATTVGTALVVYSLFVAAFVILGGKDRQAGRRAADLPGRCAHAWRGHGVDGVINFVSNDQLLETLSGTTATPAQTAEAIAINVEARLKALKASFLILAGIALLAIFPAGGLPGYTPGEVPDINAPSAKEDKKRGRQATAA